MKGCTKGHGITGLLPMHNNHQPAIISAVLWLRAAIDKQLAAKYQTRSGKSSQGPYRHSTAFLQYNRRGHVYHDVLGEAPSPSTLLFSAAGAAISLAAPTSVLFPWGKVDPLCLRRLPGSRSRSHPVLSWSSAGPGSAAQRGFHPHAGQRSTKAGALRPLADTAVQHSSCHWDKALRRSCSAYSP